MISGTPQLRLYNTLTREKADFTPLDPTNVRVYVCGPTVYDYAHIGNARPVIVFDVLFRLLRHLYGAGHVTYVRNITDVDDKINARAARDYPGLPLNEAIRKVTEKTEAQFLADAEALGCLEPTHQPRATENIDRMIALIGSLIQRGHAYVAGGEVLFSVSSMPDYGQLSGRNLEDNVAGARVAVEAHKHDPADFVLWKLSSENEPGWESPWGRGRPGWHIECSAMSERYLGEIFDIHGGGLDLIFPHHENEIAQSRCAHGTAMMAQVWMHNGFLQVEGQKMSKSLGNFVTIHDLLETETFGGRKWPGEVLRLAMLMTHYREPIDLSVKRLEEAETLLDGWYRAVGDISPDGGLLCADALDALLDDLNSTVAVGALHALRVEAAKGGEAAKRSLKASAGLLGLLGSTATQWFSGEGVVAEDVEARIGARLSALAARDFATADAIRAQLAEEGIALLDYKDPETGERRTKWEVKR
ncbi:cysteine--tRNA ligase [Devosia nitrariae]|uniref:Cysteine--tRNA ligase n=1 Tax=Devosia nitrariae TaxID=2071872 RepID=A0ABQ5W5E7_9HYPH|nr:cysteine--tRNA ligase [Devosia nitrariae]GLQ55155.1 cysteine--tRNA ligase [Devosia nitrariae]